MNDTTLETYEQWMARRQYSVVRNSRVVAAGLSHTAARTMAERLQAAEWLSSPGETSWTIDLFGIQLDTPWVPVNQQLANQKEA